MQQQYKGLKETIKKDTFSSWVRENLPKPSEGCIVLDGGYFIYNHITKKMIVIEVKTKGKEAKTYQKRFYEEILTPALTTGLDEDWTFYAHHYLKFSGQTFSDSTITFDDKDITENELKKLLSFDEDIIKKYLEEQD